MTLLGKLLCLLRGHIKPHVLSMVRLDDNLKPTEDGMFACQRCGELCGTFQRMQNFKASKK